MGANILIVDDNPTNLKLACDVLEIEGYHLYRAVNAHEALHILNGNHRIDLILMDIELPGTDGLTLTRILKADTQTRHIPIVALTAFAMKGDEQKAMQAGCNGYIIKPIDTRHFPKQIETFLTGNVASKGDSPQ